MTVPDRGRFRHELVLQDGHGELVDVLAPFVRHGAGAGERLVVVGEPDFVDTLLAAVPDVPGVHAIAQPSRARYPGRELDRLQELVAMLAADERPVRVVNQMPEMTAYQWEEWRRFEAAATVVLSPYPMWGACAYDHRSTPDDVLPDLRASHTHVLTAAGSRPSDEYRALDERVGGYLDLPPHPVERTEPAVVLAEPTAADARRAIGELAARSGLADDALETAVLAASETVTNGWLHGRPPVRLRAWVGTGRLTVAVTDAGPGPHPLVGLIPAPLESTSGRGMWILHQLLGDVHHRRDDAGYTVRFTVDEASGLPV